MFAAQKLLEYAHARGLISSAKSTSNPKLSLHMTMEARDLWCNQTREKDVLVPSYFFYIVIKKIDKLVCVERT